MEKDITKYKSQGGSKTDSDSKRGVQCRDSSILYLAFIIRTYLKIIFVLTFTNTIYILIERIIIIRKLMNLLKDKFLSNIFNKINEEEIKEYVVVGYQNSLLLFQQPDQALH